VALAQYFLHLLVKPLKELGSKTASAPFTRGH